ncbi:hypothetical protein BDQ17DRAFT_1232186 [Cyathus striatus]|nr:hypothetical protein BDQ17DRAFT_1232186 [Cyathus striatus]
MFFFATRFLSVRLSFNLFTNTHSHFYDSKHILNAQVSIRAPCCKQWYDCSECHAESQTHPLAKTTEMAFICKKCKKAFRKDMAAYEESDEYCPHCDNHYVIEAKTPQAMIGVEGEDTRVDARYAIMFILEAAIHSGHLGC